MEIADALNALRPGAQWALNGNDVSGLTWLDTEQTRPTDAEILTMANQPKVVADWDGFRQWRRQNPDYLALMGGPHGNLVGFLEADISRGDYNSAVVLWKSLKQQGAISTALEAALTSAIQQFNLGDLGAALTAHNQAQN
jgi:hypothetical protein